MVQIQPQTGEVRHGTNLDIVYFDQLRSQLDESKSVLDNVGQGRDTVTINGRTRNLMGYLEDYLFTRDRVRAPITALSGGERNRLLLARLFAMPANLLILDEPTNDLDLETLEVLEELLLDYEGTLLLVSPDRTFLDNIVTSTFILDDGNVTEYIGGYDDWHKQVDETPASDITPVGGSPKPASTKQTVSNADAKSAPRKLSYNEKRTRVDISLQRQNQALLSTAARRDRLQLRLQETVEGCVSVAAVSYYVVGLIGYAAKAAKAAGAAVNTEIVTGLAIPIVVVIAALGIRHIRRLVQRAAL